MLMIFLHSQSAYMGNSEEEHTLNQCKAPGSSFKSSIRSCVFSVLVEMDGLESKSNVIMLASTNRADVLDKVNNERINQENT